MRRESTNGPGKDGKLRHVELVDGAWFAFLGAGHCTQYDCRFNSIY
jgi:hypothetical protein